MFGVREQGEVTAEERTRAEPHLIKGALVWTDKTGEHDRRFWFGNTDDWTREKAGG